MGEDGAEGLGAIMAAGGHTIAQSEETCVVPSMPRAAILKGYAGKVLPLDNLAAYLVSHYGADRANPERSDAHEKSDKGDKTEKNERTPVSTSRG
jgi:two-component system chemotaxis response regulator CheB